MGTTYEYDANGSMTARGSQTVRYDGMRRPVRVSQGTSLLWRAAYDGDGVRRKRVDAKGTIHYLSGYERNVGTGLDTTETVTRYYRALGRLIAFRKKVTGGADTLYWVGTDHLGSTARVANSSFSPICQVRYLPYGSARDNVDEAITDELFTGQKLDSSIGLYWYGSRAYDPALGRFTCPDTIVPSAGNPQSLNRYAYCANNPLKYVDPSGHVNRENDGAGYAGQDDDSNSSSDAGASREDSSEYQAAIADYLEDAWNEYSAAASDLADSYNRSAYTSAPAVPQRVDITPCAVPEQPSLTDSLVATMSYTARNGQPKPPEVVMVASTPVPTPVPTTALPSVDIVGGMGLNKADTLVSRGLDAVTAAGEAPSSAGALVGGAASGGITNGLTQGAFDAPRSDLTEQQKLQRMETAVGTGAASAVASGWTAARFRLGRGGYIGIALAVGSALDGVKEWIFGVGGLQPR